MEITDIAIRCKTREEKVAAANLLCKISGTFTYTCRGVSNGDNVSTYPDVFVEKYGIAANADAEKNWGKKIYRFDQIPQLLLDLYVKYRIVTIDGKDIEISEESFQALKKQLCS